MGGFNLPLHLFICLFTSTKYLWRRHASEAAAGQKHVPGKIEEGKETEKGTRKARLTKVRRTVKDTEETRLTKVWMT